MIARRARGFTLVELLVVIGIIALLIGILLPSLSSARESANKIKCASNLRSVGQGLALYVSTYKGVFPASNFYKGLAFDPVSGQIPTVPTAGYVHWSSFVYERKADAGTDQAFLTNDGWEAFKCPSLEGGGLPPANTFDANRDGLPNETAGVVDWQAPRLAYTVNEALCPRGIFTKFFSDRGNVRAYKYVQAGRVKNPSGTILATEIWGAQPLVTTDSLTGGTDRVSASRRPIHGFVSGVANPEQLYKVPTRAALQRASLSDVDPNPTRNQSAGTPNTLLDWVGRNHGSRRVGSDGWDRRQTNFLYVDGHVETKTVRDTFTPFQWGERFYTLEQ